MQRSYGHLLEQLGEGACGEALSPELLPDPVAHLAPTVSHETDDVTGNAAVEHDRLLRHLAARSHLAPAGRKGLCFAGREERHPVCLRLPLVLEEHRNVAVDHLPSHSFL